MLFRFCVTFLESFVNNVESENKLAESNFAAIINCIMLNISLAKTERKILGLFFKLCLYNTLILWLEIAVYCDKCLCTNFDQTNKSKQKIDIQIIFLLDRL